MIKVVGLGTQNGEFSMLGAVAIDGADVVIVKTAETDTYHYFEDEGIETITLDHLYQESEDFDDLNRRIVEFVSGYADKNVCFCVNGSGTDDRSVLDLAKVCEVEIIPGVSHESKLLTATPTSAFCRVSSYDIIGDRCFSYDKTKTLIVTDIDNIFTAGEVKEVLARLLGDEQTITFWDNDGSEEIEVYELDQLVGYDYSSCVVVQPLTLTEQKAYSFDDLMRIMYRLRGKDGCEWDKVQTHDSIRANLIEEAYELLDAIQKQDIDNIVEEAGDVILQGVFHAVIGEDEGEFEAHEVLDHLCHKLVFRHRHIFGKEKANNAEEALKVWEQAKADEKSQVCLADKLDSLARSLPSLMRAKKVQRYAGKYGMDFASAEDAVGKIQEELNEVLEASPEELEMECGDLLFAVVNLLRKKGIEGELALGKSVDKVCARLKYIEKTCTEQSLDMASQDIAYLDQLWEQAKQYE